MKTQGGLGVAGSRTGWEWRRDQVSRKCSGGQRMEQEEESHFKAGF